MCRIAQIGIYPLLVSGDGWARMKSQFTIATTMSAAAFAVIAGCATASAGGASPFFFVPDGTQAFNSRAIAGAAPNSYATYIEGIRCHYEYRVFWGSNGRERVRVEVCN
jgi:hypothetical protein